MIKHDAALTKLLGRTRRMGDKKHCYILIFHYFPDASVTLSPKLLITHSQRLVYHENLWIGRHSKPEA